MYRWEVDHNILHLQFSQQEENQVPIGPVVPGPWRELGTSYTHEVTGRTMKEYLDAELDQVYKVADEKDMLHGKKVARRLHGVHGQQMTDRLYGMHDSRRENELVLTESVRTDPRKVDQETGGRPARVRRAPTYLQDYTA